jgi:hypothetical protein
MSTTAGLVIDLQALHAAGADCGGETGASSWLAYRPGRKMAWCGNLYDRVRYLYAQLGRRVTVEDLRRHDQSAMAPTDVYRCERLALERRRIAATPRTLPLGPPPVPSAPPFKGVHVSPVQQHAGRVAKPSRSRQGPPSGDVLGQRRADASRLTATNRRRSPASSFRDLPTGEGSKPMTAGKDRHCSKRRREIALARLLCRIIPRLAQQVRA